MFLLWYDDNPRKTTASKIAEGLAWYRQRFDRDATVVVVCEAERIEHPLVEVQTAQYVRRNNYWIGQKE